MSSSEYSDLTSLSSSEGESSRKKSKKSKSGKGKSGSKGDGGYKLRNALKVPRATTYTAQALHDQMHTSDIDVAPEYQRSVVWPETKQIKLIDSVFRNFYIPPIIFAVSTGEDGFEKKVCIDGKQRLTSIQRFMDGLIPHKDPHTDEKLWFKDSPALTSTASTRRKRLLPEKYRRLFSNKQIVCVEYYDITDRDEREIFQRVQLGMALTPAEKLQVISSERASFIRSLLDRFLRGGEGGEEESGLGSGNLDWEQSRGSDFRCVSQAVYCMEAWRGTGKGQGKDLKSAGSIPVLEKWLSNPSPFTQPFQDRVISTFETFSELALDAKWGPVAFKDVGKVAPIEFIVVALCVAECGGMGRGELAKTIKDMRKDVREKHEDIRMNDRCAKTMFEFLRNVKIPAPGPTTASSSTLPTKSPGKKTTTARPASKGGITGKRKRAGASGDSSDEEGEEQVDELEDEEDGEWREEGTTLGKGKKPARKKPAIEKPAAAAASTSSPGDAGSSSTAGTSATDTTMTEAKKLGHPLKDHPLKAVREARAKIEAEAREREQQAQLQRQQLQQAQHMGNLLNTLSGSETFQAQMAYAAGGGVGGGISTTATTTTAATGGIATPLATPKLPSYVPAFLQAQPQAPGQVTPSNSNSTTSSGAASSSTAGHRIPNLPPRPSSAASSTRAGSVPMSISPIPPPPPASAPATTLANRSGSVSGVDGFEYNLPYSTGSGTGSSSGPGSGLGAGYYRDGASVSTVGSGGAGRAAGYYRDGGGSGGSSSGAGGYYRDGPGERGRGRDWERDRSRDRGRYGRR